MKFKFNGFSFFFLNLENKACCFVSKIKVTYIKDSKCFQNMINFNQLEAQNPQTKQQIISGKAVHYGIVLDLILPN